MAEPAPAPEAPATEEKAEETPAAPTEDTQEPTSEPPSSADDDELEFLDFSDLKKAIKSGNKEGKKPVRKKASLEKAKAMLEKAEESLKEEQHD